MIKSLSYTVLALIAFAFNSILCRLALRGDEADAAGFTAVRLLSGAVALIVISYFAAGRSKIKRGGSWTSASFLFAYAICFSFAYLSVTAGTGALILFGSVQLTMIAAAMSAGERPGLVEWAGLAAAIGGLIYLVLPGLASPPVSSSMLMAAAGMSWGIYSIRGRSASDPLSNTTGNFIRSTPLALAAGILFYPTLHLTPQGILLAATSGAAASGVGYTVWYAAIKYHSAARAGILQLAVPVLAASLGILFLGEEATTRLLIASAAIIGGIAIAILGKRR